MTGNGAQATLLADGRRLHLHHGPIDIVAEAFGDTESCRAAYGAAAMRFSSVLDELVAELPLLRRPLASTRLQGAVARRMGQAVGLFSGLFVTPMAAVAGAVADEILSCMVHAAPLARAYANNGGDIALHLAEGESLSAGIVDNPERPSLDATLTVTADMPVRGVATSGWRGRSLSMGIADAVTVLAATAAEADVAATLIASAVTVEHAAVTRAPADAVRDDTDLGTRLVTVAVGPLPRRAIEKALASGAARAERFRAEGRIVAAYLSLQGQVRAVAARVPESLLA